MKAELPYALFPVINCGLDWITATSKRVGVSNALEDWGLQELQKQKAADGRISAAKRLGYVGLSSGYFFVGSRRGDVMIQVSGPQCTPLAPQAIAFSTNVSRLDFQTTIWTEGEAVDLARWTRDAMVRRRPESGERGTLSLLSVHPRGDTLGINSRVSQYYGRVYDKTAESDLGPPRLIWRYEIELKGLACRRQAVRIAEHGVHPTHVNKLVHAWYTSKGVQPAFDAIDCEYASQLTIETPNRDVLSWMRDSLSKTISKAIAQHGERTVLEALGLSRLLDRGSDNGSASAL